MGRAEYTRGAWTHGGLQPWLQRLIYIPPTLSVQYFTWNAHMNYNDVIMSAMTSQITSISIVYSAVCSGADQRKHQSSASLAFVRGIHRWPVNSPHKGPVTRKMFSFDDVIIRFVVNRVYDYWDVLCIPWIVKIVHVLLSFVADWYWYMMTSSNGKKNRRY